MSQQVLSAAPAAPRFARRFTIFLHAASFVLGFSVIFVVLFGGGFGLLREFLTGYKVEISRIGGVVVILFGLATMRVLNIPFLYYDTRKQFAGRPELGFVSSFAMGMFFAAGWTPCIGTVLGSILTLPARGAEIGATMLLATGYAIGLGVPFLIMGLLIDRLGRFLRGLTRYMHAIEIFTGVFLVVLGILLVSGEFTSIMARLGSSFTVSDSGLPGAEDPTFLIAVLGGLLSFLSPCVLPLVPAYLGYLSGHAVGQANLETKGAP